MTKERLQTDVILVYLMFTLNTHYKTFFLFLFFIYFMHLSGRNFYQSIHGQCSHFLPPENTKKKQSFSVVFRGYKLGTLARYGLRLQK